MTTNTINAVLGAATADLNATPVFRSCMAQIAEANRLAAMAKFERATTAAIVGAENARRVQEAIAAGWKGGQFRVRGLDKKDGGGFNVEENVMGVDGKPFWKKVTWCGNRAAADRAMALRAK